MPNKRWLPLEANPDVMNEFSRRLGLPEAVSFHDIYGLDPDLLAMVPRPVLAVLLLFPPAPSKEDDEGRKSEAETPESPKPFFIKQTIRNACGTIGLLHAIGNPAQPIPLVDGSFLDKFVTATAALTPEERGRYLEDSSELEDAHSSAATAGDTRAPSIDEDVDLHFIALVASNGSLFELDGNKAGPIRHGTTSPDTLLEDAAEVVKGIMEKNPESLQFNLIALSAT